LQGPQTKYQIEHESPKELGKLNHFSVVDAVNKLEAKGALQGEKIGKTRTGQPKIKWHLTLYGLCLTIVNTDPEYYSKISEKWTHLEPAILGRWKFFAQRQELGRDRADGLLYHCAFIGISEGKELSPDEFRIVAVGSLFEMIHDMFDLYAGVTMDDPESKQIYVQTYGQNRPKNEMAKWLTVFREDSDLKKYLADYIANMFELAKSYQEWGELLKENL